MKAIGNCPKSNFGEPYYVCYMFIATMLILTHFSFWVLQTLHKTLIPCTIMYNHIISYFQQIFYSIFRNKVIR